MADLIRERVPAIRVDGLQPHRNSKLSLARVVDLAQAPKRHEELEAIEASQEIARPETGGLGVAPIGCRRSWEPRPRRPRQNLDPRRDPSREKSDLRPNRSRQLPRPVKIVG